MESVSESVRGHMNAIGMFIARELCDDDEEGKDVDCRTYLYQVLMQRESFG